MKHIRAILGVMVAGIVAGSLIGTMTGCGDIPEEEEAEFGALEQPINAQCGSTTRLGVRLHPTSWANPRCNPQDSTHSCRFSPSSNTTFWGYLGTTFSTAEKSAMGAAANQAAMTIDNAFYACVTESAAETTHYQWSVTTPLSSAYMVIEKGTLSSEPTPTPASQGNIEVPWQWFLHLECTQSTNLTESYPAVMKKCDRWRGVLDYNKLVAYSGNQFTRVLRQLLQKAMGNGVSLGTSANLTHTSIMFDKVRSDVDQTVWDPTNSGEVAWVCNYNIANAPSSITCVP